MNAIPSKAEAEAFSTLTGPAPTDAAALLYKHWSKYFREHEMQSLIKAAALLIKTFTAKDETGEDYGNNYRRSFPEESTVYHSFRVAEDVRRHSNNNAIAVFCALLHDLPEDTRKRAPEQQVTIEHIVDLWDGGQIEKNLIAKILHLKTDPPQANEIGNRPDRRRTVQLRRVEAAARGEHGIAGEIFIGLVFFDKRDNLLTDMRALNLNEPDKNRLWFSDYDGPNGATTFQANKNYDEIIVSEIPADKGIVPIPSSMIEQFKLDKQKLIKEVFTAGSDGLITLINRTKAELTKPRPTLWQLAERRGNEFIRRLRAHARNLIM